LLSTCSSTCSPRWGKFAERRSTQEQGARSHTFSQRSTCGQKLKSVVCVLSGAVAMAWGSHVLRPQCRCRGLHIQACKSMPILPWFVAE
jgi:hypothetical protein